MLAKGLVPNVGGVVALTVILVKLLQFLKHSIPILVTPLPIVQLVRPLQFWKA